jgi:hypothetical protein
MQFYGFLNFNNEISFDEFRVNLMYTYLTLLFTHYTSECDVIGVTDSSELCTIVDLKMAQMKGSKHVVNKLKKLNNNKQRKLLVANA